MSQPRRRLLAVARWVGTVAMLGWVGWRLAAEWQQTPMPALTGGAVELVLAGLLGAVALLGLAGLYVAGLAALDLPVRGHVAWHLRTWLQGYVYRYVPGKVMLVVERARLGERVGVPKATSVVLVLWETVLLLAGACCVALAGLAVVSPGDAVPPWALAGAGVAAVAAVFAFPHALRILADRVPAVGRRLPPALLAVPARTQALLVAGYAGVWALLGGSFALTCRAFEGGQDAGLAVVFWFVLSYVAGLVLSVTPAGLGVREGLLVVGLSGVFPATAGLAFALASRVLMTVVELALVAGALLVPAPPPAGPPASD